MVGINNRSNKQMNMTNIHLSLYQNEFCLTFVNQTKMMKGKTYYIKIRYTN